MNGRVPTHRERFLYSEKSPGNTPVSALLGATHRKASIAEGTSPHENKQEQLSMQKQQKS